MLNGVFRSCNDYISQDEMMDMWLMDSVVVAMHFNILVSMNWIFFYNIFQNFQGEVLSHGCAINPLYMPLPKCMPSHTQTQTFRYFKGLFWQKSIK